MRIMVMMMMMLKMVVVLAVVVVTTGIDNKDDDSGDVGGCRGWDRDDCNDYACVVDGGGGRPRHYCRCSRRDTHDDNDEGWKKC